MENIIPKEWEYKQGIYAICIDDVIVYIGQTTNMRRRCSEHRQQMRNGSEEKKYQILRAAKELGHSVSFRPILEEKVWRQRMEKKLIGHFKPILNTITPTGKNDISELKIEDVLERIKIQ